jgi:hypothetical protein
VLYLCGVLMTFGFAAFGAVASDPAKIVGPNACAECHKQEAEAWKGTHHFKTFREMPRKTEANEIAKRMGVRRVKSESLCLNCHFTVQQKDNKEEPITGISCESCHSAGKDWIKVHSGYSGKKAQTESKAEAATRWKLAESKGMIRPSSVYRLAKNCYGCHVVPREDLVNKGGHRAGSAFELVSWSQGEVRQADALSRRPRRRTRDCIARGRKGDCQKALCIRDGYARRPGSQAAGSCGESGAECARNRKNARIWPFGGVEAEQ